MPHPVLIIGAGPYGVSVALELHRRAIPFVICGKPFSLWFNHTLAAASLRSDIHVSEVYTRDRRLRLDRYLDDALPPAEANAIRRGRIPVTVFRDYLRHVLATLPFPIEPERIASLDVRGGEFVARTQGGRVMFASQVVLACGLEAHQRLPQALKELNGVVAHGWHTHRYEHLRGRRVMIVGSGQSAGEAVWKLRSDNEVTWVYRRPPVYYADPIALPRPLFALAMRGSHVFSLLPAFVQRRLRQNLLDSTMTPDLRHHVQAADVTPVQADVADLGLHLHGEGVRSGQLGQSFDQVIACTGYRHRLDNLAFLSPAILAAARCHADGMPVLDRSFRTTVAGLYIVGAMAEPKHGPAMRFMSGCRSTALLLGRAVQREMHRTRPVAAKCRHTSPAADDLSSYN
jgi:cation diffusion facilitator CzcD-associated flavoprotein CzcO